MRFVAYQSHFAIFFASGVVMILMIAEQSQSTRGLYAGFLGFFYFASILLFGLEHETASTEGWKKYLLKLSKELEEKEKFQEVQIASNEKSVVNLKKNKYAGAVEYLISRNKNAKHFSKV